ncbi:DNA binding domain-containing protein [Mycobacteroides abscessus subsp. abscessus]|nr:hypothetical protein [Mycobacteroides abscessus]SHW52201.1 DNA binding domain-containing protein [Mycobacteroides abscessus subsp. abscessus]SHX57678.1 DNA binding domain-containing protein [Mycobacteroides abscessus subsp. abscessus]SHZ69222.1 DNA binding domain-containing protein [Mycobacteroides abscessus subsp. abscessus]SIA01573.1 DNA binding domain-containing protein [Mycobacteroides abscessus subsp. abscessus]
MAAHGTLCGTRRREASGTTKGYAVKQTTLLRKMGYRPSEVASATGISLRTIQRRIADGTLVAHRCGGVVLVYPEDLDAWLGSLPRVVTGDAA